MADARPDMISRRELEERLEAERARWFEEQAAEAALKEEREKAKSCLESITPQFKERRGVVYNDFGPNLTFKIDPSVLASLRDIQFNGLKDECPIDHLRNFLDIASCYQVAHVSTDQLRLRLFHHSLAGRAKDWWWNEIPEDSVHTWEELQQVFMKKFFPPSRTQIFIREISNFGQEDDESLAAAFERFRELLRKCPHHGQTDAALVRSFTNGLHYAHTSQLDMMSAGNFLDQSPAACWALIEKIVSNSTRAHQRGSGKAKGVLALSSRDHAEARASTEIYTDRMARFERELEALKKKEVVNAVHHVACVICGGAHSSEDCPETKSVAYVQGQYNNRNPTPHNWANGNNRNWTPQAPPQQAPPSSSWQPQNFPNQDREPSLREVVNLLAQSCLKSEAQQAKTNEKVTADLNELKSQVGKVIELVTANQREPGNLPSNTINPRNEHVKAITLRNGKEVQEAEPD
jgi:hypothetical protein